MVTLIKANQPVQNWTRTHKCRKWLKLQQILATGKGGCVSPLHLPHTEMHAAVWEEDLRFR